MLKTFTRPAMIFIPFLLGVLFPQAHVLNDPPYNAVRWALAVMVFLSCLQIRFSELKPRREHWHLLGMNLLMGIVPYFVLRLLIPGNPVLATRLKEEAIPVIRREIPEAEIHETARTALIRTHVVPRKGTVAVICAGTSDLPVAEEACDTVEICGYRCDRINDVGVAGLHRLLNQLERLRKADVREPSRGQHLRRGRGLACRLRALRGVHYRKRGQEGAVFGTRRGHEHARHHQIPVLADDLPQQERALCVRQP